MLIPSYTATVSDVRRLKNERKNDDDGGNDNITYATRHEVPRQTAKDYCHTMDRAGGGKPPNLPPLQLRLTPRTPLPKAAVAYLCCGDEHEVRDFELSLALVAKFFASRWPYPIVVLHDYLSGRHISRLTKLIAPLLIPRLHQQQTQQQEQQQQDKPQMKEDYFSNPASPAPVAAQVKQRSPPKQQDAGLDFIFLETLDWQGGVPDDVNQRHKVFGYGMGYRHMCRFFSGPPLARLPALRHYDYLVRVDTDSFFLGPVLDDPIQLMRQGAFKYGWLGAFMDQTYFTTGLWRETEAWIESNRLWEDVNGSGGGDGSGDGGVRERSARRMRALQSVRGWIAHQLDIFRPDDPERGTWDDVRYCFATNFFAVDLAWWRSEEYASFFEQLDRAGGFYRHRWGDACVHFLAAAVLLDKESEVVRFPGLMPYWHQGSVLNPEYRGLWSYAQY
jgi:hypothetical protein